MIQFGTGGWRARIGEDFTCDNVRRVGGAVCAWLKENGRTDRPVIIGYDRRFLSCEAAKWLAEVFCAQGFQVLFLHRSAPTPLLMHTVLKQHLHCALQVTASHNPAIYNGIKLIVEEGGAGQRHGAGYALCAFRRGRGQRQHPVCQKSL